MPGTRHNRAAPAKPQSNGVLFRLERGEPKEFAPPAVSGVMKPGWKIIVRPLEHFRAAARLAIVPAWLVAFAIPALAAPAPVDVRILVDVSGSMKANDPNNLRVPAVRLVAELMPRDAIAGVWLFSEGTETLIPAAVVDGDWKKRALKALGRIHSRGQFTDIEAALGAASADWQIAPVDGGERHIILLTDGMVDVSKQAEVSAESRGRILNNQLARIKALGARVHTIALSENSDRDLLTTLAATTEGWAEEVADASSLQRVFLHMFEQATKPDSIPLLDNRFDVDASVSEMTLLVFRGEQEPPLRLVTPAGKNLDLTTHPDNVSWRSDNGYDLVTVSNPLTGTWQINTKPDPDNRVMIVTDLKLVIEDVPAYLMAEEALRVQARITEQGTPIDRPDFLQLLSADMTVATVGSSGLGGEAMTLDSTRGVFVGERVVDWPAGDYELLVRIDGGTFKRQQRTKIRIHGAPFTFASGLGADGQTIDVEVAAAVELVDVETLSGIVVVARPDQSSEVFDLPAFDRSRSRLVIPAAINGPYQVEPRVFGQTLSGRFLSVQATPLAAEVTTGTDLPSATTGPEPEPEPPPSIDWIMSSALVLGGNLFVGLLFAGVWFTVGRRKTQAASEVVLQ